MPKHQEAKLAEAAALAAEQHAATMADKERLAAELESVRLELHEAQTALERGSAGESDMQQLQEQVELLRETLQEQGAEMAEAQEALSAKERELTEAQQVCVVGWGVLCVLSMLRWVSSVLRWVSRVLRWVWSMLRWVLSVLRCAEIPPRRTHVQCCIGIALDPPHTYSPAPTGVAGSQ